MATTTLPYEEEIFGILTDDDLYLDCTLVRPSNISDDELQAIRVWVPKFPLTQESVITCARHEVNSLGAKRKVAHLVFDLRGTGNSDGLPGDHNFDLDLKAVKAWARERFGRINFGFLGTPTLTNGRVNLWPLTQGSTMECYYYPAGGGPIIPPSLLYLSTYGNFNQADDKICAQLAEAGYHVYGLDPLRYLLHASLNRRLTPEDLWRDAHMLIQMLPSRPIIIAQPLAAGLGLLWTSGVKKIAGIIAIGRAQAGLSPSHIFQNSNPYTFSLHRYLSHIPPRPLSLIRLENSPLGGDEAKMHGMLALSKPPHRFNTVTELSADILLEQLNWIDQERPN